LPLFTGFRQQSNADRTHDAEKADKAEKDQQEAPEQGAGEASDTSSEREREPESTESGAEAAADSTEPGPEADESGEAGTDGSGGKVRIWHRWREEYPAAARVATHTTTVLAGLLILAALMLPNAIHRLVPGAFIRLPLEAILIVATLLIVKPNVRPRVAVFFGAFIGLLTVVKMLDMGFYSFLDRPFDIVLDWVLFDDAESFLEDAVGKVGAVIAVILVVLLVIGLLLLMTRAMTRLDRLMRRHHTTVVRTTLVVSSIWIVLAMFGAEITNVPVAATNSSALVHNRVLQVEKGLKDGEKFAKLAAADDFGKTPPEKLLTKLRGKDVIFAFVESYGRTALEHPQVASKMGAALKEDTQRLSKAGYESQSGWLKSPVTGSGSWMAHATFMSGLWIDNQQRYRTLTSSDRLTLTSAFKRTKDWRTVGMMPGVTESWPEGKFYGLDHVYAADGMGYKGPKFSWSPVPDQYTLSAFERREHSRKDRQPIMSEIVLATSHNPWSPLPTMTDWDKLGNGSLYHAQKKAGKDPQEVWRNAASIRTEYQRSVEYSMESLTSYLEKYGDDDTVMVVLGDHQPIPAVTGNSASRDVPISVIARDKKVMKQIADWQWQDGLKPAKQSPVWRMSRFRDRFMTAYGPNSEDPTREQSPAAGE
jgi:hypothetical protein